MDFFEHQEQARKKTGVLIFYFVLAVLGIIVATYALATGILFFLDDQPGPQPLWRPETFLYVAIGTAGVIFIASAFKAAQLSGGGAVVARELGGRELDLNTTDYHERRLLNVVEEMAIASGVPVPTVFLLDSEESINAFAAGKTTSDAVIGVTRGCMTLLTRDELQGVMAHEFSHILNGDMRLNIRLMSILFGILFLALMGELIMRFGVRGGMHSSRREGAGAAMVMLVAGLGLLAIGYVGNFFGNLIKASVSRQREFLADASAVQFTRNPDGLAGALMKIGGLAEGSRVEHPMARDASHLFFGNAFRSMAFATHPPLEKRIRRLLPHWDGELKKERLIPISPATDQNTSQLSGLSSGSPVSMLSDKEDLPLTQSQAVESMSMVHPEQVQLGRDLYASLPEPWIELCRSQFGAQAIVFSLLLAQDETLRREELQHLGSIAGEDIIETVSALSHELQDAHSRIKFGLIDLALPTLRHLSRKEYAQFKSLTQHLIESDRQVDLFEFSLLKVINRHLDAFFEQRRPDRIRYKDFHRIRKETGVLLTTLAAMSHPDDTSAQEAAFREATERLANFTSASIPFLPPEQCGLAQVDEALDRIAFASPIVKKHFLDAASYSVLADGYVASREAELIRAIADAMGCPIPPFVRIETAS